MEARKLGHCLNVGGDVPVTFDWLLKTLPISKPRTMKQNKLATFPVMIIRE